MGGLASTCYNSKHDIYSPIRHLQPHKIFYLTDSFLYDTIVLYYYIYIVKGRRMKMLRFEPGKSTIIAFGVGITICLLSVVMGLFNGTQIEPIMDIFLRNLLMMYIVGFCFPLLYIQIWKGIWNYPSYSTNCTILQSTSRGISARVSRTFLCGNIVLLCGLHNTKYFYHLPVFLGSRCNLGRFNRLNSGTTDWKH